MSRKGESRRAPEIRSENRECAVHGITEHRQYKKNQGKIWWRCLQCAIEAQKVRAVKIRTGAITVIPRAEKPDLDDCKHLWQRDVEGDQDWCHSHKCSRCGTTTITLPGKVPE